jgi:hypothetical protein
VAGAGLGGGEEFGGGSVEIAVDPGEVERRAQQRVEGGLLPRVEDQGDPGAGGLAELLGDRPGGRTGVVGVDDRHPIRSNLSPGI